MTLDVITSTAFGIETETVKNGDSVWLQKVKWIFNPRVHKKPLHRKIIQFILCKYGRMQIHSLWQFFCCLSILYQSSIIHLMFRRQRNYIFYISVNSPGLKQIALKVLSGFFTKYLQWFYTAGEAIIKERKLHPVREMFYLRPSKSQILLCSMAKFTLL